MSTTSSTISIAAPVSSPGTGLSPLAIKPRRLSRDWSPQHVRGTVRSKFAPAEAATPRGLSPHYSYGSSPRGLSPPRSYGSVSSCESDDSSWVWHKISSSASQGSTTKRVFPKHAATKGPNRRASSGDSHTRQKKSAWSSWFCCASSKKRDRVSAKSPLLA